MLVGAQQQQTTPEQQETQRVNSFMEAILSGAAQQAAQSQTGAPAINAQKLAEALPSMGLTEGLNFDEIYNGLQGNEGNKTLQNFAETIQRNTILSVVPMMNELVRQAMETASRQAVTETHHNLTSSAIVTAFNDRYGYGNHPTVSPMLTQFANGLAQSAPRTASPAQLADALHGLMQSLGSAIQPGDRNNNNQGRKGITDMRGLFEE
jgi:hypothetical protein